MTVGQTIQLHI